MKINKKEALALAKVLHQHTGSPLVVMSQSEHDKTVHALQARLDRFIMVDGADADHVDEDCCPKESPAKKQAQPCDFFDDGEDDDEDVFDEEEEDDEEEDGEQEAAVDLEVPAGDLHDLAPAKATVGAVEFEHVFDEHTSRLDLLLDGETTIEHVTHLRRHGKSLEVKAAGRDWTSFEVSKFPKGWASALPLGELAAVEG